MSWIHVSERLPRPNQRVRIKGKRRKEEAIAVFITCSDGKDHFWDNGVDHIWQAHEVTHWKAL